MRDLPTGTVTFVFTDVEGSTVLIQRLGVGHRGVFETHARIVRAAMSEAGGIEAGERGDGFFFAFAGALDAVRGAAAAQRALAAHPWPPDGKVRVRIGAHTGDGVLGGDSYLGIDVNRAARIAAAGHGGEVIVSAATAELARRGLPPDLNLRDLGSHRLKDLPGPEQLVQLVIEGLPSDFPPPRTLGSTPNNLPAQLTSFVGRERELREIRRSLDATRLLTLTGPGGTGKTRLGLRAAAEAASSFPDGVHFVPLASITDASLVPPTVLSALGVPQSATDPAAAVSDHLRPRQILLVLDNFEQVLEAGPRIAEWLRDAPDVKALVTSRAPLRVSGESEYPVPPLGVPDASAPLDELRRSESVALFVARAAAARPDFALTREHAAAVAKIAARLDGLPLAIELAASRVRLLPPEAILSRLASRLTFLTGGARDLPARQQTLRDTIAWSYGLLDPPVKRLFRRLGAFVGGFSLPQAEAVCGSAAELGVETLDGLAVLVDHSLVRQGESGGEPRFGMLETIRELARELLAGSDELSAVEERHTAAYVSLAEESESRLTRRHRRESLDRLDTDIDNLRAALARLLAAGDAGRSQRMVGALWRFWQMRGHVREGRQRAAEALALGGGPVRDRISALWAAGGIAYWRADTDSAGGFYDEALALAQRLGERRTLALALYNASFPSGMRGEMGRALRMLDESLAIARELGDRALAGEVLWGIGTVHWYNGAQSEAEPWYDRALEALEGTDAVFVEGWALRMRGAIRAARGDTQGARADAERSMRMFAEDDDLSGIVLHLQDFAVLALAAGDTERALRLAGAAAAAEEVSETAMLEFARNKVPRLAEAAERLGSDRTETLLAEGRAIPLKQAVAYALERPS